LLCVWDGYGFWPGGVGYDQIGDETPAEWRIYHRRVLERAERFRLANERIPRVRTKHRDYFLFEGPLSVVGGGLDWGDYPQSPNFLWPPDRAWCAVTEIDGYSTYVGTDADCAAAILACPDLESIAVALDVRMDPGPY
jgi:hypothetical protein